MGTGNDTLLDTILPPPSADEIITLSPPDAAADDFADVGRLSKQPVDQADADLPITLQEARFVEFYLAGTPATHAYADTHGGTEDMPFSQLTNKAAALLKSRRVQEYLNKIRSARRGERDKAAAGDIVAHIRDGENLSPLQVLENLLRDMERAEVVVDNTAQQKRLYVTWLHAMMARQYGSAVSALREMSETAGLKIERKQVVIANLSEMSPDQLAVAVRNQRTALVDLGFNPSELTWMPTDDITATTPAAAGHIKH